MIRKPAVLVRKVVVFALVMGIGGLLNAYVYDITWSGWIIGCLAVLAVTD